MARVEANEFFNCYFCPAVFYFQNHLSGKVKNIKTKRSTEIMKEILTKLVFLNKHAQTIKYKSLFFGEGALVMNVLY